MVIIHNVCQVFITNSAHAQWLQISLTLLSLGFGWVHSHKTMLVPDSVVTQQETSLGVSSLRCWTSFGGKPTWRQPGWAARLGMLPHLLRSGHGGMGLLLGQTRRLCPSFCIQECDPEKPGWWGKLLMVAATQRQLSKRPLPPGHVSVGIRCPRVSGQRGLTLVSTLGYPWLWPYCWVYYRPCPFSEPDSPASPLVLEASREFIPAYAWVFWWFTHGQMTLETGKWMWQ